jgi:hypothetical protein
LGDATPTSIEEQRNVCPQIAISDVTNNSQIIIHQKEINECHPTLGCKKTMTGCSKEHKISPKKKSDEFGIKVKNGEFNCKQGWMAMKGPLYHL